MEASLKTQYIFAPGGDLPGIRRHSAPVSGSPSALALAIRNQDAYTRGHARRVAAYSQRIAKRLRLPADEVCTVSLGGLLHDIGKIAFSRQLLQNTGHDLSEAMRQEIRLHPEVGFKLLGSLRVGQAVRDGVRFHHERINGSGYPCGLSGEMIPLAARIISVADCYDALTTDRPYQSGKNPAEALAILEGLGGVSLDADVVQAFIAEILERGKHLH